MVFMVGNDGLYINPAYIITIDKHNVALLTNGQEVAMHVTNDGYLLETNPCNECGVTHEDNLGGFMEQFVEMTTEKLGEINYHMRNISENS